MIRSFAAGVMVGAAVTAAAVLAAPAKAEPIGDAVVARFGCRRVRRCRGHKSRLSCVGSRISWSRPMAKCAFGDGDLM